MVTKFFPSGPCGHCSKLLKTEEKMENLKVARAQPSNNYNINPTTAASQQQSASPSTKFSGSANRSQVDQTRHKTTNKGNLGICVRSPGRWELLRNIIAYHHHHK